MGYGRVRRRLDIVKFISPYVRLTHRSIKQTKRWTDLGVASVDAHDGVPQARGFWGRNTLLQAHAVEEISDASA